MIGVLRAELARTVRRVAVWLLGLCAVLIAVVVGVHNVDEARSANDRLAFVRGSHVVDGCIAYADGTASGICPGRQQITDPGTNPGTISATPVPRDPEDLINAWVEAAEADRAGVEAALAPAHRVDLAIALLGSTPGIVLAIILGALIAGGDYAWGTARAVLLAARSRNTLVAGRFAALWLIVLVWLLSGAGVSYLTYAALAGRAGLEVFGVPQVSVSVLIGALLSLGLFSSATATLAMVMRSSLGATATGLGLVAGLRLIPQFVGIDLGPLDVLRAIARLLTPQPVFASTSSSITITGAVGMPSTVGRAGSTIQTAPTLAVILVLACVVLVGVGWVISSRQEVR